MLMLPDRRPIDQLPRCAKLQSTEQLLVEIVDAQSIIEWMNALIDANKKELDRRNQANEKL